MKQEVSLSSISVPPGDHPPEIADYLMQRLSIKQRPIDPDLFKKDPTLGEKVTNYEDDLNLFLQQPNIITFGKELLTQEKQAQSLTEAYHDQISNLGQLITLNIQQRSELEQNLQQLEKRIAGIGRDRIMLGDWDFLKGRIQMKLDSFLKRGHLSLWDRLWTWPLAIVVGGRRSIHPQFLSQETHLAKLQDGGDQLEESRKQVADHYVVERVQKGAVANKLWDNLSYQLDQWVMKEPEYYLVHYLFYRRPDMILFFQRSNLQGQAKLDFINHLRLYGLITRRDSNILNASKNIPLKEFLPDLNDEIVQKLSIPLRINDHDFTDSQTAKSEFLKLVKRLPEKRQNQIFNRLVMVLKYESLGMHHPDSELLVTDDMIERIGGNWRLRIGRYRVIGNFLTSEGMEKILELVEVIGRDNAKYY